VFGVATIRGTTNNDTTNIFRIEQQNQNGRFSVNASGQTSIVGDNFQSSENFVNITRNSFNPTSGTATHTSLIISPTINQTGGANGITRGLYIAPTLTSAFDFRAIETTAGNVLFNGGNVGIGTATPNRNLVVFDVAAPHIQLATAASGIANTSGFQLRIVSNNVLFTNFQASNMSFGNSGATHMTLFNSGNLLISSTTTTDAGFKLDVNGTARIQGNTTFGTVSTNTGMLWDNTNNRLYLGTGSSTSNFDIRTTGNTDIRIGTTANYATFEWNNSSGETVINSNGASNWPILFRQNNVEKMRIGILGTVLIGTPTEIASSRFTVNSTTQGVLFPRMTTTQKNAISSPATGLVVFDTTLNKLCVYTTTWETITSL
jgi:hypothetical protein